MLASTIITQVPCYAKLYIFYSIFFGSLFNQFQILTESFRCLIPTTYKPTRHFTVSATNITTDTTTRAFVKAMNGNMLTSEKWHWAVLTASIGSLIYFTISLYEARKFFRRLQKDGMPMPPHHPIFGHLGLMLSIMLKLPRDVMPTVALADQVRLRHPHLDRAFYLDMWPFTGPVLVILSPSLLRQATQGDNALPKVTFLKTYMKPLSGGHDLVSMEGEEWRRWRDVFRPAFTRATDLVPGIVDNIQIFRDQLAKRAEIDGEGGVFQLHHLALNLAMDMSGKVIWGHDMNSQTSYNDMADAIVSQLGWLLVEGFMPLARLNFIRPLIHKYNEFRMERYLDCIQREMQSRDCKESCVISRVIKRSIPPSSAHTHDSTKTGDPYRQFGGRKHFDRVMKSQMRFLLLAGYDTTGASITYVLHMLSKYPDVLARIRKEHCQLFGADTASAAQQLKDNPQLVNCVPYTAAVIKETLRMYPPTSTLRNGKQGVYLVDDEDVKSITQLPTEGCMIFGNHHGLHHNPRYWKDPEEFRPERFLVSSNDPSDLHPLPDAWRPVSYRPEQDLHAFQG